MAVLIALSCSGYAQELTEEELFGTEDPASQQSIEDIEKQIEKELSNIQDPALAPKTVTPNVPPPVVESAEPPPPFEAVQPEELVSPELEVTRPLPTEEVFPTEPEALEGEPQMAQPQDTPFRPEPEVPLKSIEPETVELNYPPGVAVDTTVFANVPEKRCNCSFNYLKPYAERRGTFGFNVGVGYSTYTPLDYKPDFVVNNTFENYYGAAETPLIEVQLGPKWNMGLGSLSVDLAGGYYKNENRDLGELTLMPARAGATLALDTLWQIPYVVPYASGGGYVVFYEEKLRSQRVGGNTPVGIYYAAGLGFQLNWLDETSASIAYDETGLENTYLFVEGRSFVAAGNLPNLGSEIQLGAGLKLEY